MNQNFNMDDPFVFGFSVSRRDLELHGIKGAHTISDESMKLLAQNMEEMLLEGAFWDTILLAWNNVRKHNRAKSDAEDAMLDMDM